jgi:hypothetical protein
MGNRDLSTTIPVCGGSRTCDSCGGILGRGRPTRFREQRGRRSLSTSAVPDLPRWILARLSPAREGPSVGLGVGGVPYSKVTGRSTCVGRLTLLRLVAPPITRLRPGSRSPCPTRRALLRAALERGADRQRDYAGDRGGSCPRWRISRMSHVDFHDREAPLAPSAINANASIEVAVRAASLRPRPHAHETTRTLGSSRLTRSARRCIERDGRQRVVRPIE